MPKIRTFLHLAYNDSSLVSNKTSAWVQEHSSHIELIEQGSQLVIGRAPRCDIYVDDRAVSQEHCVLINMETHLKLVDKSANGIFHNQEPIGEKNLKEHELYHLSLAGRISLQIVFVVEKTRHYFHTGVFDKNILLGKNLGNYHIEKLMFEGVSSYIYRATQRFPERTIALKVMKHSVPVNDISAKRFKRFTNLAASFQHPTAVTIYQSGCYPLAIGNDRYNFFYIAMEFIGGKPLANLLKQEKIVEEKIIPWILLIASGLEHFHAREIIHRNLSTANIVVFKETIKIVGTKLLKKLDDRDQKTLTVAGRPLGVMPYSSPEELRGDKDIDQRSDIYSLGCILYELLTRKRPFRAKTILDMIKEIQAGAIPPSEFGIPKTLSDIVLKAIDYDRLCRYTTMEEFKEELIAYQEQSNTITQTFFGLFPFPQNQTNTIDLEILYKPHEETGGDFYFYFQFGQKLFFCMGDVKGHGQQASLVVAMIMGALNHLVEYCQTPEEILQKLHDKMFPSFEGTSYFECICGLIDEKQKLLTICHAGKLPLLLFNPDRKNALTIFEQAGTPVSLVQKTAFGKSIIPLQQGDIVLSFTDGILEAQNQNEEEYGLEHIPRLLHSSSAELSQLLARIYDDVLGFTQNKLKDDATIFALLINE